MKNLFGLILLLCFPALNFAQTLFFKESQIISDKIPMTEDSRKGIYSMIKNGNIIRLGDLKGGRWFPINENEIVIVQNEVERMTGDIKCRIYLFLISTGNYTLLLSTENLIEEISASSEYVYFTYKNKDDNWYQNLFKLNIRDRSAEKLFLPKSFFLYGLNISKDDKRYSFYIYSLRNNSRMISYWDYYIMDIENRELIKIDSTTVREPGVFGGSFESSSYWQDENNLLYYKWDGSSAHGTIYKYNIKEKLRTKYFVIPFESVGGFAYHDGTLYFQENGVKDDVDKIFMYRGKKEYIYSCANKYDYIYSRIFIR